MRQGFTLIELVTVLVIIAALSAVSLPVYLDYRDDARASAEKGVVGAVRTAIHSTRSNGLLSGNASWPPALDAAAANREASSNNPFFTAVLATPVTDAWRKTGTSMRYVGPTGNEYEYLPDSGRFALIEAAGGDDEDQPPLYSADFEGGADDWFEAVGRNWAVVDGKYTAGPGGEHRSFSGDTSWTDYSVVTNAKLLQGQGFGLYFRSDGQTNVNGYIFQYDPGYGSGAFLFRKIVNGQEQGPFAVVRASSDYDWYNVERQIEVVVEGNSFTARIDGEDVLTASDDTYSSGGIGLRTWGTSMVEFEDVTVSQLAD